MHQTPVQHAQNAFNTAYTQQQAPYAGAGPASVASSNTSVPFATSSHGAAGLVNGVSGNHGAFGAVGEAGGASGAAVGVSAPHRTRAASTSHTTTPAHSPSLAHGSFRSDAGTSRASVTPSVSGGGAGMARNGTSPPKKKKRREGEGPVWEWGADEMARRRGEVIGKAQDMALKGALRIELILEKGDTMPALAKANLPTHKQQLRSLPQPNSALKLTLEDYLTTFHAWAAWTADVEVSTFPITGALMAYFLVDRVPAIADRPNTIFILEQYRKATAEAFVNLSTMSMSEITAREKRLKDGNAMLHKFDWALWRAMMKEAGRALRRWKAIEELAPATHGAVRSRSATQSATPAPVASSSAGSRAHTSSASQTASPALHPAAAPSSAARPVPPVIPPPAHPPAAVPAPIQQRPTSSYPLLRPTTSTSTSSTVLLHPQPIPVPSTSQPLVYRPPVLPPALAPGPAPAPTPAPAPAPAAYQPVHLAPVPAPPPKRTIHVKGPVPPPITPSASSLLQAAAPLSAKARGKQRASDPALGAVAAAAAAGQVTVPVRQVNPATGAPVALVPIAAALVPAAASAPVVPAPPPKRKRRISQKMLAEVQLPPEDQAEENAFFAAARELQDALAEFTTARHLAATRLAQAVEQPRAVVDSARPYSDYRPLPIFHADVSGITPGLTIRCFDSRDGLNALRPPPTAAKPQHLEFTSQPLRPAGAFSTNFNLVAPHFLSYPEALRPVPPASIPNISGYAFSLGQETAKQLYASSPTAAQQFPRGTDAYEVEVRRRLAGTAKQSILAVRLEELPMAREPAAAREARMRTSRLLAVHAADQEMLRVQLAQKEKQSALGQVVVEQQVVNGEKVQVPQAADRPLSPHTPAEPNFPPGPAPPASASAMKTPSGPPNAPSPATASPASASPASASRPLHRPTLGTIASAPAVPGARPRSASTGMGRRPSVGGADVHPLLKFYANAPNQVRSFARAKAAEITGVPSDEFAAGLAKATERMSQSPMLGRQHPRLPNGHSPLVGAVVLPTPDNGSGNGAAKQLPSPSPAQNAIAGSSRPRNASPPLVPIPLAPVEEVADAAGGGEDFGGGFDGGFDEEDIEMAEAEPEKLAAEPPVPTGETALGVTVDTSAAPPSAAPSASAPTPIEPMPPIASTSASSVPPVAANPAPSTPAAKNPDPPSASPTSSALSSFGTLAKATVGAVSNAARAIPGLAGFGNSPPSDSGSPAPPANSPPGSSTPAQPAVSTSAANTPASSSFSSRTGTPSAVGTPVTGSRGPRKCGVCGSGQCPGRGGRQWCKQGKEGGGEWSKPASPSVRGFVEVSGKEVAAASAKSDKAKGKQRAVEDDDSDDSDEDEVAASLLVPRKRPAHEDPLDPPPVAKQPKKVELDKTKHPNPLRDVPKVWLAVSDPIMPFSMLRGKSRRKSRSRSRSKSK